MTNNIENIIEHNNEFIINNLRKNTSVGNIRVDLTFEFSLWYTL